MNRKNVRSRFGHPVDDIKYILRKDSQEIHIKPKSVCAVVVHLYYLENWSLFSDKLKKLQRFIKFDLYITKPIYNKDVEELVRRDFPNVYIFGFPNRGRDVLPFVNLYKQIGASYEYFLKFHSKKSTHWDGGQKWLEDTLSNLIPDNQLAADKLISALSDKSTGVVGPYSYYYPLTVNFPANGTHISRAIKKIYGKETEYKVTQEDRIKYGFFGGTMFWGRFDALDKIMDISNYKLFEPEKGQIDGTYAHALERLFCVCPEIDGKRIFEFDGRLVNLRSYESQNIPDWSTDHDK